MGTIFEIIPPHPRLGHIIKYYWTLVDDGSQPSKAELLFPDGNAEIIFNRIDAAYRRWLPQDHVSQSHPKKSYIVADSGKSVFAKRMDKIDMVGVKLSTQGLFNLLKIPIKEFSKAPIYIEDIGDVDLQLLHAVVLETQGSVAIKTLFDAFFLSKMEHGEPNVFQKASAMMLFSKGQLKVGDVIEKLDIHYSTLERSFKKYSGMSPKAFQQMVRFRHCYADLQKSPLAFLQGMQYLDWGYYDQNHFIKEFQYYTDTTPHKFAMGREDFSTQITENHMERDTSLK